MVLWNQRMYLATGEARYVEILERALYNGALAGMGLSGDRFFYENPLGSKGDHHRVPWFDCSCCPSNLVRFLPSLGERIYLGPIVKGLAVTLRHFLRNLFGQKDVATIQYPEVKRQYSERLRGRHILTPNPDGSLRCVACYMCETACPADCITIVADEDPNATVEWEKGSSIS